MRRWLIQSCQALLLAWLIATTAMSGCQPVLVRGQAPGAPGPNVIGAPVPPPGVLPFTPSVPTEKDKTSLPTYVIEPPDSLLIDAVKLVPKPPYKIEPLDIMQILVVGTLQDQPISGQYPVDPGGMVDLGPSYGRVRSLGKDLRASQGRDR